MLKWVTDFVNGAEIWPFLVGIAITAFFFWSRGKLRLHNMKKNRARYTGMSLSPTIFNFRPDGKVEMVIRGFPVVPLSEPFADDDIANVLQGAIKRVKDPCTLVQIDSPELREQMTNDLIKWVNGYRSDLCDLLLHEGEVSCHCLMALVFEEAARNSMPRVMFVRKDHYTEVCRRLSNKSRQELVLVDAAHHLDRLNTLEELVRHASHEWRGDDHELHVRNFVLERTGAHLLTER